MDTRSTLSRSKFKSFYENSSFEKPKRVSPVCRLKMTEQWLTWMMLRDYFIDKNCYAAAFRSEIMSLFAFILFLKFKFSREFNKWLF